MNLVEQIRAGNRRSVARAITWVENELEDKEKLIDALYPHCGRATIWGITGPPGAGKSTLLDRLITHLRREDLSVGVIATDPSSPFSGGAILGDRLRMQHHATDPGVFIRSMASRGYLGGVSGATADAIKVLDAAGFDLILVETIGVGQTEIDIMTLTDVVLLVLVPGLGDEIQALKAGVMEIGDVFVVNKQDHEGADKLVSEIRYVLSMKYRDDPESMNPVVKTSALMNDGMDEMIAAVRDFEQRLHDSGEWTERRKRRIEQQVRTILATKIRRHIDKTLGLDDTLNEWVDRLYHKQSSPYHLINTTLDQLLATD
jgi:LAO/AO transport system kinase